MNELTYILIACFTISLGSFAGVVTLAFNQQKLSGMLLTFVALSAGALMGGAFLHLLPEAVEESDPHTVFILVLVSFSLFFFVEKILHWRHCHKGDCDVHTFGVMNLIGDSIHNFIDGLIIAAAFMTDVPLGIATSIAVALHEIPQEIGDFGVLLYSGYRKKTAIIANFLVASIAIVGGVTGYLLSLAVHDLVPLLLPVAAGGFIYIAASDLMPEIRKEKNLHKSMQSFAVFLVGIVLMYLLSYITHDH